MTTLDTPAPRPPAPTERTRTFAESVHDALDVALTIDPRVVHLGLDAVAGDAVSTVTKGLAGRHGAQRVRSASSTTSTSTLLGVAIGLAMAGKLAVAEIVTADVRAGSLGGQLLEHAAQLRYRTGGRASVPMVVRVPADGGVPHSSLLETWAARVPGLKVVVPSTPADAKGLLLSSVFDPDPVLFVETVALYSSPTLAGAVLDGDVRVPVGKAAVRRKGKDVSVLTYGRQVWDALAVADRLADEDIDVEVVDLRTLVPLDEETVFTSVAKTKNAVVLHQAATRGGFGAELATRLNEELFADLEHPVARVGAATTPVPYAPELERAHAPSQERLAATLRSF